MSIGARGGDAQAVQRSTSQRARGGQAMRLLSKCLLFAAVLTIGFAPTAALADRNAEQFVGGLLEQTSQVLRDNNAGDAARRDRLHQVVMQNLDARNTALFALGRYQRDIDPRAAEE